MLTTWRQQTIGKESTEKSEALIASWAFTPLFLTAILLIIIYRPVIHTTYSSGGEQTISNTIITSTTITAETQENEKQKTRKSTLDNQTVHHSTPTAQGIDISHYQGNINWGKINQNQLTFVYIKATEGITYQDPLFDTHNHGAQTTTLLRGAYHFFEVNDDAQAQANNFLTKISDAALQLTPMLDIELSKDKSPTDIQQGVLRWLSYVQEKTGCRPIVYSYGSFWESYLGTAFNDYAFWLADYASSPRTPAGLPRWKIWQYSDKGRVPGIRHSVDANVVRGGAPVLDSLRCAYQGAASNRSSS